MRYLDIDYDFYTDPELRSVKEFADSMDKRIDATEMLKLIEAEDGPFKNRKEFCEAFGIGESTLSGWLKGDRIPKVAKLCVGLLNVTETFTEDYSRLKRRLNAVKNSDRIVRDGDRFMIVSFSSSETHTVIEDLADIGTISAREIPDVETARRLTSHQEVKDTLKSVFDALMAGDMCDNPEDPLLKEVERHIGPVFDKEDLDFSDS
jgi:hypothetical protein